MRQYLIGLLNWAVVAVSVFNTIALLWLGLTVLLNAEQRRWGTWGAGAALAVSGFFFAGHTALIARDLLTLGWELEVWLSLIWLPFVSAPYFWYLVMGWYTGVLGAGRHRIWLSIVSILGAIALLLPLVVNPLPSYGELRTPSPPIFSLGGVPVFLMVYPVYSVLCIVLSLSALWRPEASERFMGDLARRRARPWLLVASLVLLLVGLTVGGAVAWLLVGVQSGQIDLYSIQILVILHAVDLLVSSLIAVLTVLIGKAIVSYEIFTGKTLPRGGLLRYWRNSLILAAGYGVLLAWSLDFPVDPVYRLMLATVLMTLFYALLSWRSYAERERSMERLRPFVASQQLYDRMMRPLAPPALDIAEPFRALCNDVLDAEAAYLISLGPLATLGGPVAAAEGPPFQVSPEALSELAEQLRSPQTMCIALSPARHNGAVWAVPLWSERGLIGVLLLGHKRGNGLYTQEEIEIARAAGERLIDARASAELARRLMSLQRQRLSESQVVDRHTRRVLHDDVLPQLHATMLMLQASVLDESNAQSGPSSEAVAQLADIHRQIANLLHEMPATAGSDVARLGLVGALRGSVANELGSAFDSVSWRIEPEMERRAEQLPALTAEVMFYAAREAIRNAARYGRGNTPARRLHLTITIAGSENLAELQPNFILTIEDDGVGIGTLSPPTVGSGRGLALHSTMLAVVGGALSTESQLDTFTRVRLTLPIGEVLSV